MTAIDEKVVQDAWGCNISNAYTNRSATNYMYSYNASNYNRSQQNTLSSTNAYMLLYRKIAIISSEGVPRLLPIPVVTDDLVPQYIHDLVSEDLKQKEQQRKLELEILNRLKLRVYLNSTEYLIESNKTNTLTELMRTIWQSIDLLGYIGADTVAAYMNEKNRYKEDGKGESYVIPIGPNNAFASSEPCFALFRLRLYNSFTHYRSDTYDVESQGSETLTSLGMNEYKVYIVETRKSTEQWEVFHADGFTVIIVEYDPVTLLFKEPRSIRLKKFSILSDLKAIIASWGTASYAIEEIMLMKIMPIGYNDVHINVFTKDDDRLRLKEDLGIYDGFRLYMDRKEALEAAIAEDEITGSLTLGPPSLNTTPAGITDDDVKSLKLNNAPSPAGTGEIKAESHHRPSYFSNATITKSKSGIIEAFLSHRNKLELKIVKSADVSMEKTISVDGRISVAQLRQVIARECFDMPSGEDVRVFKQHCKGVELKDGTQTLIDHGLFNGINISAAIGKVTPAGFFSVTFMKYIAPVVRTVLNQLPDLSSADTTVDTTFDYGDDFDDDTIPHLIHIGTINSNNSTDDHVMNMNAATTTYRGGDDDCRQNTTSIVDLTYQDDAMTGDRESDASSNLGIADLNETPYFDDDDDDDDMGGMNQHAVVYPDVSLAINNDDDNVYYTSSAIATAVPVEACIGEESSSSSSVATVVAEMVRPSNPFSADVAVAVDSNSKDPVVVASVCNDEVDDVEASGFGIAQVRHPHDDVSTG